MKDKNKGYTAREIKRDDRAKQFHHITDKLIKEILHAVDNNIMKKLPILQEDFGMAEDIYGSSIPNLK